VVVIQVKVSGEVGGRTATKSWSRQIFSQTLAGKLRSAIQVTTAASACTMIDLLAQGHLQQRGFVRQEEVVLADFLGNRFGAVFAVAEDAMLEAA
jgi:saccharopine dehydrogenase-like NADP-dependent oxidoreductase